MLKTVECPLGSRCTGSGKHRPNSAAYRKCMTISSSSGSTTSVSSTNATSDFVSDDQLIQGLKDNDDFIDIDTFQDDQIIQGLKDNDDFVDFIDVSDPGLRKTQSMSLVEIAERRTALKEIAEVGDTDLSQWHNMDKADKLLGKYGTNIAAREAANRVLREIPRPGDSYIVSTALYDMKNRIAQGEPTREGLVTDATGDRIVPGDTLLSFNADGEYEKKEITRIDAEVGMDMRTFHTITTSDGATHQLNSGMTRTVERGQMMGSARYMVYNFNEMDVIDMNDFDYDDKNEEKVYLQSESQGKESASIIMQRVNNRNGTLKGTDLYRGVTSMQLSNARAQMISAKNNIVRVTRSGGDTMDIGSLGDQFVMNERDGSGITVKSSIYDADDMNIESMMRSTYVWSEGGEVEF